MAIRVHRLKLKGDAKPLRGFLKLSSPPTLACGSDLKNVFSLANENSIFYGPLVGDLEDADAFRSFRFFIDDYKKKLNIEPEIVVVDKHPAYISSRYGRELGLPVIEVQHHHAHIASVMAEQCLSGEVIGIALDGTGYGCDGSVWGGEILIVSYSEFTRAGHFKPITLPGGNAAVREPWRTASALLFKIFGEKMFDVHPDFVRRVGLKQIERVVGMMKAGFNCPLSSGAGRLFDGVSSLLGIRDYNSFEGEGPIELEKIADFSESGLFEYHMGENGEIDFYPMIEQLVEWSYKENDIAKISARFHNTIAAALSESCMRVRSKYKLNRVCLGGGVFQNRFLVERLVNNLRCNNFQVFMPKQVPINDSGLSLGQTAVAISNF